MKHISANKQLYGRFRNLKRFTDFQKKEFKKYLINTVCSRIGLSVRNKQTGLKIIISQNGLKHSLSVGANITKMKTITVIDKLLISAMLMDVKKDRGNSKLNHFIFRNIVSVDGEYYFITMNVKEDNQGNYYYHHYLTDIKKPCTPVISSL